jgi:LuxR family transcriptional regulator, maltose regulon positive regulatory protein
VERLQQPARVTMVSAPPGSGKTVLLRSWISEAGLAGQAGWVTAGRDEHDPQRFWLSVLDALRGTAAGSVLVRAVSAAPGLDGWVLLERLLNDLAPLAEPVWLVIDDVHELGPDVLRQLELMVLRAPPRLRFVLAARHDVRLGLHRLRLEGDLTEIRQADLRFTVAEARELFAAAGVQLPEAAAMMLHERTEGWAAGLRLAALSLAGHPDPGRFACEFSGSERTVAEYLLAEVLDRQSPEVRRLLLRTSVLERVNGELADLLAGGSGGERVLQDLEQANAFVGSLDASRSWFRYHQMFAGLLRLELRRAAAGEVTGLHQAAAGWFAGHGFAVEAIRHAQAAQDWPMAAGLLAGHWAGLYLDGQAAAVHELLAGFPGQVRAADAELAAIGAADELTGGSLEAAERYLGLAERGSASVPAGRQGQFQVLLEAARLLLARQRGNVAAVAEAAQRLQDVTEDPGAAYPGLGEELRALALITVGVTEFWAAQPGQAERHLDQGVMLARQIGRPYLEFFGLAHQAAIEIYQSFARAAERSLEAIELAERHGWTGEPAAGVAYVTYAGVLAWQGQPEEAEPWLLRAECTLKPQAEPAAGIAVHYLRGRLELARGRHADALAALQAAERLGARLAVPHLLVPRMRASLMHALIRMGEVERAEQALGDIGEQDRDRAEMRMATAALRLAQHDPGAAAVVLGPVLDGSVPADWLPWQAQAFWLEAIARDALGDEGAAGRALERALELAGPGGAPPLLLLHPAPGLLERQAGQRPACAALIAGLVSELAGQSDASSAGPRPLPGPLRDSETRVLRYLPTNLTLPEIARELDVSHNTVKTHIRSLYAQLGAHRRSEAVDRARALGLLAPAARRR